MAVEHVERLLRNVTQALERAGIPYAVVGGNAVAAWVASIDDGAVRATKDLDILLRREDLQRTADVLREVGLEPHEVHGIPMFLDRENPNPKTGVDVIIARELVKNFESIPAPDVSESVPLAGGCNTIALRPLVIMKLQAFRRHDQVHIEDMIEVGLIDDAFIAALPEELRGRAEHIRDTMERN